MDIKEIEQHIADKDLDKNKRELYLHFLYKETEGQIRGDIVYRLHSKNKISKAVVEDTHHDIFRKVINTIKKYDYKQSGIKTWIKNITINYIKDCNKKNRISFVQKSTDDNWPNLEVNKNKNKEIQLTAKERDSELQIDREVYLEDLLEIDISNEDSQSPEKNTAMNQFIECLKDAFHSFNEYEKSRSDNKKFINRAQVLSWKMNDEYENSDISKLVGKDLASTKVLINESKKLFAEKFAKKCGGYV